jgi:putative membrane protein
MGYGMGMGWGWLFGLLMLVGVILLVVLAVRALGGGITRGVGGAGSPAQSPGRSRAREVLDERYARGEITTEEYRERLQTLGDA